MKNLELNQNLSQFHGTEHYHAYYNLYLTDGIKYLAEQAQCYWLIDVIWSHTLCKKWLGTEDFITCTLTATNSKGRVIFDDGNDNILAKQEIPYTDFPLDKIKIFIVSNGDKFVVMLPSEY